MTSATGFGNVLSDIGLYIPILGYCNYRLAVYYVSVFGRAREGRSGMEESVPAFRGKCRFIRSVGASGTALLLFEGTRD
jgi:hypothetical protein